MLHSSTEFIRLPGPTVLLGRLTPDIYAIKMRKYVGRPAHCKQLNLSKLMPMPHLLLNIFDLDRLANMHIGILITDASNSKLQNNIQIVDKC